MPCLAVFKGYNKGTNDTSIHRASTWSDMDLFTYIVQSRFLEITAQRFTATALPKIEKFKIFSQCLINTLSFL